MTTSIFRAFVALTWIATATEALQWWKTPGQIPTSVPARCRVPLTQNITCDVDDLVTPTRVFYGETVVGGHAEVYCAATCRNSLKAFQKAVTSGCGHTPYKLWEDQAVGQSVQEVVDGIVWAQDLLCMQDSDDDLCLPALYAGNKTDCSVCALKYGAGMQAWPLARERYPEDEFLSVLSSCSVPASSYPYTFTSGAPTASGPTTTTSAPTAMPTCAGTKYKVKTGDTCKSISKAQSVSTDRLINRNHLDYSCTTLTVGQELCIEDTCPLVTVHKNQTCLDLVAGKGFTTVQLTSWNPSLKGACDTRLTPNLDNLEGRHFCIQAPGGSPFPTSVSAPSQPNWRLTSTVFDEWQTATEIPDDSAPTLVPSTTDQDLPLPTQSITYNTTLDAIIVEHTKYCWITERDWDNGYNPETYPDACQSFYNKYCFYDETAPSPTSMARFPAVCTPKRDEYMDDVYPVETPSPIQPGLTGGCNKFYKVVSGDGCQSVATSNNVTLTDFYTWNPAVGTDCMSLQLNVWVCVGYDSRLLLRREMAGLEMPQPTAPPAYRSS